MKLKKNLGLIHVFCIASGAMISSGIFVLPGLAHARTGPSVVISYFLAGLLASIGLLNIAELATAMPKAGGDYFFVTRTLGPAVGTIGGLLTWFSLTLKSAFALVGMGAFAQLMFSSYFPDMTAQLYALIFAIFFTIINIVGVKHAARFQVGLVMLLLGFMAAYIVVGMPQLKAENFDPIAPMGLQAIIFTAGFVFVSYGGLLKVSSIAEEVKNPGKVIPLGMLLSLIVVMACYTLMVSVTTGVMPGDALDGSLTPVSDGAYIIAGTWGRKAMSFAAVLAFITTANAGIMAASRYILALGRDELAPDFLNSINRYGTPHNAILVTAALAISALFLELGILVEGASTVLIMSYALSCLCVIILRESRLQNYRPRFQAPFYPWIQIVGLTGFSLMIFSMSGEAHLISLTLILIGFLTYWFYGRSRTDQEYALLHLLDRMTSKKLVTGRLESELKEIIRERDTIVLDHFDRMVENCHVIDIKQSMMRDDLFRLVAEVMALEAGITAEQFQTLLISREEESSTVLTPSLAVPHIVVDEDLPMMMLMARCNSGIEFNESALKVKAVIVLAGSKVERNLHLRSLAAIAQIVQSPDFDSLWREASGKQALRDIFLLGDRRRVY